jgi:hypothetical protein
MARNATCISTLVFMMTAASGWTACGDGPQPIPQQPTNVISDALLGGWAGESWWVGLRGEPMRMSTRLTIDAGSHSFWIIKGLCPGSQENIYGSGSGERIAWNGTYRCRVPEPTCPDGHAEIIITEITAQAIRGVLAVNVIGRPSLCAIGPSVRMALNAQPDDLIPVGGSRGGL